MIDNCNISSVSVLCYLLYCFILLAQNYRRSRQIYFFRWRRTSANARSETPNFFFTTFHFKINFSLFWNVKGRNQSKNLYDKIKFNDCLVTGVSGIPHTLSVHITVVSAHTSERLFATVVVRVQGHSAQSAWNNKLTWLAWTGLEICTHQNTPLLACGWPSHVGKVDVWFLPLAVMCYEFLIQALDLMLERRSRRRSIRMLL